MFPIVINRWKQIQKRQIAVGEDMTVLQGFIQGIIQGLTEFLPVSSSGHLTLFQYFFGIGGDDSLFFDLMLHLGTLAAVIAVYYQDLWNMLKEFGNMVKEVFSGQFVFATKNPDRKMIYMLVLATLPLVLVVPLRGVVSSISGDNSILIEGFCFLFTSLLLFGASKAKPGRAAIGRMKGKHALTIGVMQGIATLPGISRSGSTISTGLILGFERQFMVKFSFLLGIPAILGASVFEIGDAIKEEKSIPFLTLFVGMITAAVVGYISIKLVCWLLLSNKFIVFAWYTLALGIIVIVVSVVRMIFSKEDVPAAANALSSAISTSSSAINVLLPRMV